MFDTFDTLGGWSPGAWFSANKDELNALGKNVTSHRLAIKNPAPKRVLDEARMRLSKSLPAGITKREFNKRIIDDLKSQGYDGIHEMNNNGAGGKEIWVAFDPEQILK